MAAMDWEAWARKAERAIDMRARGGFQDLFAAGATFADPATTTPTTDLRLIARETKSVFPDWSQEITSIRGGDGWAVFEWTGRATYRPGDPQVPGSGADIVMHGATIVEVDGDGLVTRWRDYLDRKEPEEQIRSALKASGASPVARGRA